MDNLALNEAPFGAVDERQPSKETEQGPILPCLPRLFNRNLGIQLCNDGARNASIFACARRSEETTIDGSMEETTERRRRRRRRLQKFDERQTKRQTNFNK